MFDFRRFREIADEVGASSWSTWRILPAWWRAGRIGARSGTRPSSPRPSHKTPRGPRCGLILTIDEELAKKINSAVFPGCRADR